jgi:hypothetical protein
MVTNQVYKEETTEVILVLKGNMLLEKLKIITEVNKMEKNKIETAETHRIPQSTLEKEWDATEKQRESEGQNIQI